LNGQEGPDALAAQRPQADLRSNTAPQLNPASGLFFLTEYGEELANIGERAQVRAAGDPCAGWRANVSPGAYRLRLQRKDGTAVERAIYAPPNAQVQVFLQVTDYLLTDGTKRGRSPGAVSDQVRDALALSHVRSPPVQSCLRENVRLQRGRAKAGSQGCWSGSSG
jgi:hypothetical protein